MFNKLKFVGIFVGAICLASFALNTSWAQEDAVNQNVTDSVVTDSAVSGEVLSDAPKGECPKSKFDCSKKKDCDSQKKCDSHGFSKSKCGSSRSEHGHRHGSCAKKQDCGSKKACKSKGGYHSGGHSVESMMGLVYSAKKELLKEKIKVQLDRKVGHQLDEIADLFVNALVDQQTLKADQKKSYEELEKKLREICTSHGKKAE